LSISTDMPVAPRSMTKAKATPTLFEMLKRSA
jgi:hypothetical protein